jgi:polar amino acid transport system ATP-binding protein/putative ABC transport system ATP-binding protein
MIQCKNIELTFSGKRIFDNLNFYIEKGENVCLSGPSGKGKTTLLKILQGYIIPDKGQILINNTELNTKTIKEIRDSIVWIPQNINLPVKTGWELLHLLHIRSQIDVVKEFSERLGIDKDIISKDFSKISGGQKQRIIIAICLSLNKKIILMDEPTSSLDDVSIHSLIKTVQSLNGKTIVSASHNRLWVNSTDKKINL